MFTLNEEIYNTGNLNKDNANLIRGYDYAIEDASNREFIIDDLLGADDSTIGKMKAEIANEVIDKVVWYMQAQREDLMVSLIDSQEEFIEDEDL